MNSWWGKIIGAFFGMLAAGPIGALMGIAIGHLFDRGLNLGLASGFGLHGPQETQKAFFKATFQVMGHVAKADGRVSETEIRTASQIMRQMGLNEEQRKRAINFFNQGKQTQFDLAGTLNQLIESCHQQRLLLRMFLEIQFQAAMAEGDIGPKKYQILQTLYQRLGFEPAFSQFRYRQQHYQGQRPYRPSPQHTLQEAYNTLEVNSSASKTEIKRAYRKLMSQHHPDKLIAKGLPEEMIKVATDKTQQIQKAYEAIKDARGFN